MKMNIKSPSCNNVHLNNVQLLIRLTNFKMLVSQCQQSDLLLNVAAAPTTHLCMTVLKMVRFTPVKTKMFHSGPFIALLHFYIEWSK